MDRGGASSTVVHRRPNGWRSVLHGALWPARRKTESAPLITVLVLFAVSLAAGFIDSIAGGGGLLTVPALALAGYDPLTVVATNKLQSSFGSGSATLAYWRAGHIDLATMGGVPIAAAAGSFLGAMALSVIPRDAAMSALPFLLLAVALYFALAPRLSDVDAHQRMPRWLFLATIIPAIGFYDGVFGPGTGSFDMIAFVALMGFGLLKATAHTKLANFASNLAGLLALAFSGHMLWGLGLAMGVGQFLGARLGVHLSMRHGARLVKPLLITVCCILALRLMWEPDEPDRRMGPPAVTRCRTTRQGRGPCRHAAVCERGAAMGRRAFAPANRPRGAEHLMGLVGPSLTGSNRPHSRT